MCMDAYTEGFRGSLEFHTCEGEKEGMGSLLMNVRTRGLQVADRSPLERADHFKDL